MRAPRHPWLSTAVAVLITAVFLLPVYWMVKTSLTRPDRIETSGPQWVPRQVTGENYSTALGYEGLTRALFNSLVISCGVVALTLLLGVPLAYALARVRMRGSGRCCWRSSSPSSRPPSCWRPRCSFSNGGPVSPTPTWD
jgi:multiple sugar transport system permease protein